MASLASKKLLREHPTQKEMLRVIAELGQGPDQALAVTGLAYLENIAEQVLRAKFIALNGEEDARIFDASAGGILGSMSAKLRIIYALGLLPQQTYADLLLMNQIRNVFAHSLHQVTFSNPEITQDCGRLSAANEYIHVAGKVIPPEKNPKFLFSNSVFLLFLALLTVLDSFGKVPPLEAAWPGRPQRPNPQKEASQQRRASRKQRPRNRPKSSSP